MFIDNHHLPPLLFLNSIQSNSDSIPEINAHLCQESPIIFQFSDSDKRLHEFYQKGICDLNGKATEAFKSLSICPFNEHKDFSTAIPAIHEALAENKTINARVKITEGVFSEITLITSLKELFSHVIELSKQNELNIKTFQIIDIYLIGSSTFPLLGKNIFELITLHHFNHLFSDSEIKDWFKNMEHLNQFFKQKGNDLDTRIILSSHRIDEASALSDAFVSFLSKKIPQYARSIIRPHYPEFSNEQEMLQSFFLSSSAIKNRKRVNESHSVFALLAINTAPQPIDINCVGSVIDETTKELHPLLEYPNLTSLNSLSISLSRFLSNQTQESCFFHSHPFGIQVLLDLLFNCSTPTTYNHFGWRYFLRKHHRMTHPEDEKKMIQTVMQFRLNNDFSLINKHKFVPNPLDSETLGGFIYLLLANDFVKVETEDPSDPFILSEYLFRACLSLTTYSAMNDQDCKKLWECVDQYYWDPLQRSSNIDSICHAIKDAILKDKIPFSVLSAYTNILGYLFYPTSATTHCHTPVIALKKPFSVFLPIQLIKDCETIDYYFSLHSFPDSLKKISTFFIHSSEISFINFPLKPYFDRLNINSNISISIEKLIFSHSSPLKLIGLQLYLSILPNSEFFFTKVINHLPTIFIYLETWQQKKTIIQTLQYIAENKFEEALPLIGNFHQFNFKESSHEHWLSLLLEVNTPHSIKIGYSFFKDHQSYFLKKQLNHLSWKLFQHLLLIDLDSSFNLFNFLMKRFPLPPKYQFIGAFISLNKQFEQLNHHIQSHTQLKMINAFHLFFDIPKENVLFEDENNKLEFSTTLHSYLKTLNSAEIHEKDMDYFLLESSRRGYLTRVHRKSLWSLRLEQLIQQKRAYDASIFYLLTIENKWIQQNQIILKSAFKNYSSVINGLLKEKQCQLSRSLLAQLFEISQTDKPSVSIFELLINFLKKNSNKILDVNDQKLIETIFLFASDQDLMKLEPTFLEYFKSIFETIHLDIFLSHHEKNSVYQFFDQILINSKLIQVMNTSAKNWKKLLLEYLDHSEKHSPYHRGPQLWLIFDTIIDLSKLSHWKNKKQLLLFIDCLLNLLTSSSQPPKKILTWFENSCKTICHHLYENKKLQNLKTLLNYILNNQLTFSLIENYTWKACTCDPLLRDKNDIELFLSINSSKLQSIIPTNEYPILCDILNDIMDSYPTNSKAAEWMDWAYKNQHLFSSININVLFIKYVDILRSQSSYKKAFEILKFLSSEENSLQNKIQELLWDTFEKLLQLLPKEEFSKITLSYLNKTSVEI
ncbi:MAG: hypothetical protein Q8K60_01250, partial [Parachlamydiaceae bacterium]|nr:hypothetical protein [Parachlamydiaceae bacterium]